MTSLRSITLLLLAFVVSSALAETNTYVRGVGATSFVIPDNNNSDDDLELLQKEIYWGMKEMKRYNALRGSWPVREGESDNSIENATTAPMGEGCA